MKRFLLLLLTFFTQYMVPLQALPAVIENKSYDSTIRTVQCYPYGDIIAMPIYRLDAAVPLVFSFDKLGSTIENYNYTLVACDRNWQPVNVSTLDYLEGFSDGTISNYQVSFNTTIPYVHYILNFPNADMKPTQSGNYALVVYSSNIDEPVITQRIMVVESKITTSAFVTIPKIGDINTTQEIVFECNIKDAGIQNAQREIFATVMQNNRSDNAISNISPIYERLNTLSFDWNGKIVFESGREFRRLDMRTLRFKGDGIASIYSNAGANSVIMHYDKNRNNEKYFIEADINGSYFTDVIEYRNDAVESDYAEVTFKYFSEFPVPEDIYIIGSFNNWQCDSTSMLKYDTSEHSYYTTQTLKLGYYNYTYVTKSDANLPSFRFTEGNFFNTENDYTIFIYYMPFGANFDRLIGVTKINSNTNRF
jgi:hypothetical protein